MDWNDRPAGQAALRVIAAMNDGDGHAQLVDDVIADALAEVPADALVRYLGGFASAMLTTLGKAEGKDPAALLQAFALMMPE